MQIIFETLQYDYAIRALLASAMVGIMCGVLGCFIVLRNMSLIGDALSHAILPGVVAGFMVAGYSVLGFFTGSVLAGLLAAVLITWIQRNVRTREDAAIGIVFTAMFAIGVMGISHITRQEGVHLDLKDFLFGNVLGISDADLWMSFLVMVFTLICVIAYYRYFFITTFESVVAQTIGISVSTMHYFLMLLLSFAVVASLQSVGVILVVAMLITPASTASLLTHKLRSMLYLSALVGLLSTTLGLLLAIWFETTPGPAMTVTATGFYLLAVLFSPTRGLVSRYLKRRRRQIRILREDVLKQALQLQEQERLTSPQLAANLGLVVPKLREPLRFLRKQGFLQTESGILQLTEKGLERGYELVRAHRLWETYLVKEMGLSEDQIHEDAERYEHILTDTLMEEVARKLGYPTQDPHGSPIPQKLHSGQPSLAGLAAGEKARISEQQLDHLVRSTLWEQGIEPRAEIEMLSLSDKEVAFLVKGKHASLDRRIAERIRVERG